MSTDTPRTDAAEMPLDRVDIMASLPACIVHADFARELERELEKSQKLEAENVCLQELIQEFYEWSRRDFPNEQEVREIMNRYYDLLNK